MQGWGWGFTSIVHTKKLPRFATSVTLKIVFALFKLTPGPVCCAQSLKVSASRTWWRPVRRGSRWGRRKRTAAWTTSNKMTTSWGNSSRKQVQWSRKEKRNNKTENWWKVTFHDHTDLLSVMEAFVTELCVSLCCCLCLMCWCTQLGYIMNRGRNKCSGGEMKRGRS